MSAVSHPPLIELTMAKSNLPVTFNINRVLGWRPITGGGTMVLMNDGTEFHVSENYHDIMSLFTVASIPKD